MSKDLFTDVNYDSENQTQHWAGPAGSSGYGIAEYPHIRGTKVCVSRRGCKLGDGRKKINDDDSTCGLCGGRIASR